VRLEREDGLPRIAIRRFTDGEEYEIAFAEEAYALAILPDYEYDTTTLRFTIRRDHAGAGVRLRHDGYGANGMSIPAGFSTNALSQQAGLRTFRPPKRGGARLRICAQDRRPRRVGLTCARVGRPRVNPTHVS